MERGLSATLGESSHYTDGRYVRIRQSAADVSLERVSANEGLVRGDGESQSALIQLAHDLSDALSSFEMRHRIELHDGPGARIARYFHNWPAAEESS